MRYLTKSRFQLARQCVSKLQYSDDPRFSNSREKDEFARSLAEGGHRVGALAKLLFPEGIEIGSADNEAAIAETLAAFSSNESITLFEPAVAFEQLLIRADVLRRSPKGIELFEVKAKSYDSAKGIDGQIVGTKGNALSEFRDYLYDALFQRHVLRLAFPGIPVLVNLIMVDKTKSITSENAPSEISLVRDGRRVRTSTTSRLRDSKAADEMLHVLNIDAIIDRLEDERLVVSGASMPFAEAVIEMARQLTAPAKPVLGAWCKKCEFRADAGDIANGKIDGRAACWRQFLGYEIDPLSTPTVLDIYSLSESRIQAVINSQRLLLREVVEADVGPKFDRNLITQSHRQWLQCEEARTDRPEVFLAREALRETFGKLKYPLHFIDFETASSPIPFHAGMKPYQLILFQFSHHLVSQDGRVEHTSEFLLAKQGQLPSFDCLRALKACLGGDGGSVIHWWDYERTVIGKITEQLADTPLGQVQDRDDLVNFYQELLKSDRLVDLGRKITHEFVFVPGSQGRSSIKVVLPKLLDFAPATAAKYSKPNYGSKEFVSLNFQNHQWISVDAYGKVRDPYDQLQGRFADASLNSDNLDDESEAIKSGGSAMIAYLLLQGSISEAERNSLEGQLRRYCELDTLAMVMAWEAIIEIEGKK